MSDAGTATACGAPLKNGNRCRHKVGSAGRCAAGHVGGADTSMTTTSGDSTDTVEFATSDPLPIEGAGKSGKFGKSSGHAARSAPTTPQRSTPSYETIDAAAETQFAASRDARDVAINHEPFTRVATITSAGGDPIMRVKRSRLPRRSTDGFGYANERRPVRRFKIEVPQTDGTVTKVPGHVEIARQPGETWNDREMNAALNGISNIASVGDTDHRLSNDLRSALAGPTGPLSTDEDVERFARGLGVNARRRQYGGQGTPESAFFD